MTTREILTRWIQIARDRGMAERANQFWLLRDFLDREVWSDVFCRKHAEEAYGVLVGLDDSKPEQKQVAGELLPIVKGYMV